MGEKLLTVQGAAELLSVSARTINRLVATHQLSHTRVGSQLRFDEQDVQDYLSAGRGYTRDESDLTSLLFKALGKFPHSRTTGTLVEVCGLTPRGGKLSDADFQRAQEYCQSLTGRFALQRADRGNREAAEAELVEQLKSEKT